MFFIIFPLNGLFFMSNFISQDCASTRRDQVDGGREMRHGVVSGELSQKNICKERNVKEESTLANFLLKDVQYQAFFENCVPLFSASWLIASFSDKYRGNCAVASADSTASHVALLLQ